MFFSSFWFGRGKVCYCCPFVTRNLVNLERECVSSKFFFVDEIIGAVMWHEDGSIVPI